jgi:hypothetical protein
MDTPNGAVFHRAYAHDDTGLENEAESILLASEALSQFRRLLTGL